MRRRGSVTTNNRNNMKTTELTRPDSCSKNGKAAPSDLGVKAVTDISQQLRPLLADVFVLYVKTKNFHWHMSGPHFRDYHLLLDEQAEELFGMTDEIAERARKLGGTSLRSIGDIARHQRLRDNDAQFVPPQEMLAQLAADNQQLTKSLRSIHEVCDQYNDMATASLIENWIDQAERRTWFLSESVEKR